MTVPKSVAGKNFRGADQFWGGGRNPQNLKFRANHKRPPCELFWDPGFRGGGARRSQRLGVGGRHR